jgi:hypothetical protein
VLVAFRGKTVLGIFSPKEVPDDKLQSPELLFLLGSAARMRRKTAASTGTAVASFLFSRTHKS